MDNEFLKTQLSLIRPGDKVTARFVSSNSGYEATVTGVMWEDGGWTFVGPFALTYSKGEPASDLKEIVSHTTPLIPEPPVHSLVRDGTGTMWRRKKNGWIRSGAPSPRTLHSWEYINENSPVTILAIGVKENNQ